MTTTPLAGSRQTDLVHALLGAPGPPAAFLGVMAYAAGGAAHGRLRHDAFVDRQGLFDHSDRDDVDEDPRLVTLLARGPDGAVLGGVRLAPGMPGPDIGWWRGSRLVTSPAAAEHRGVGSALVRAACAQAEAQGALRFDADVQRAHHGFFTRLGWETVRETIAYGRPHVAMRWPIGRIEALARATKLQLGTLLAGLTPGSGFTGDDGAPVPGSDLVAACDSIVPAMVERDPAWAGWCAVLVNVNDLSAMGAEPVALLDALAARDASFAARILSGLRAASAAYGVPVIGGHTPLGAPAALSVTALGRTTDPVPGGGGRPGHEVRLTADLGGAWRSGHVGTQWDSTTRRSSAELQTMISAVRRARPAAAKDVSMAGVVGTLGMLAEASGCGADLDVVAVPRPSGVSLGDWLTCFPGFAMLTADDPGSAALDAGPAEAAACGRLSADCGVRLCWPDGESTSAIDGPVTGLGQA